jgi:periplasmic divalent cation tolerance protein
VDKANEVLLILKSKRSCFQKIVKAVKKYHSYEVPEIIALPIIDGNSDYLNWVKESCLSEGI